MNGSRYKYELERANKDSAFSLDHSLVKYDNDKFHAMLVNYITADWEKVIEVIAVGDATEDTKVHEVKADDILKDITAYLRQQYELGTSRSLSACLDKLVADYEESKGEPHVDERYTWPFDINKGDLL